MLILLFTCIFVKLQILTKALVKVQREFCYNIFLRLYIQAYVKLAIIAFIQLFHGTISVAYALAGLIIVLSTQTLHVSLIVVAGVLLQHFSTWILSNHAEALTSFSILFREFKNNRGLLSALYYPLFCLRRFLMSLGLIALSKMGMEQCIVQGLIAATVLAN
mmetsp:Transcript_3917/g.8201  ORF Transcript_3917/g.8201 Transcript_3917/m.8201 type:complete len:162 (+) Transcript_3917:481-966(+)